VPRALPKPFADLRRGRTRLRFFHGDAIHILKTLGAGSIDAIVTSPPYNLGIRYRSYDDGRPRSEYLEWTADWVRAAKGALSAKGGSSAVACAKLGVSFVGIELDEHYLKEAVSMSHDVDTVGFAHPLY